MTTCRLCGKQAPRIYCYDCGIVVNDLRCRWGEAIYEFTDELCQRMKSYFQDLPDRSHAPIPLELVVKALEDMGQGDDYYRTFREVYEELTHPGPDESPSEEELREQAGDRKFHLLRDEGVSI